MELFWLWTDNLQDEIVGDTFSATCALSRCMSVARVESGDASFIFTEKLIVS